MKSNEIVTKFAHFLNICYNYSSNIGKGGEEWKKRFSGLTKKIS